MTVLDWTALAGFYGTHNNSLANLKRGIMERVFLVKDGAGLKPCPQPIPHVFANLRSFRTKVLSGLRPTAPMTYQQFADSYQGRKWKVYTSAVESLRVKDFDARSDSKIKAFVKAEKTNFDAKPDPAPRIIQPRSPRFNVVVGRYLKPLEHLLYHRIDDVFGAPVVAKGRNAKQRASMLRSAWDNYARPVAIMLDASRFDQHVSKDALRYEHSFYLRAFGQPAELQSALSQQLENNCVAVAQDGMARYTTMGCRMSGDMNTSCGNVLLMCAMMYHWIREMRIRANLVNDGDDCVLITEQENLVSLLNSCGPWFLQYGFEMSMDGVTDIFERIDFCQCRPVKTAGGWVMCRNPHTALDKDLLCVRPLNEVEWSRQCSAVAACGLAISSGLPVFQPFYRWMDTGRTDYEAHMSGGLKFLAMSMRHEELPITDECRVSFYKAWDLTPQEQRALEERYETRNRPGWSAPVKFSRISRKALPTRC